MLSLANLGPKEREQLLNSPLSIKACKIEGIKIKELLYIPVEKFWDGVAKEQIVELRFKFHEEKRLELLESAKWCWEQLIA